MIIKGTFNNYKNNKTYYVQIGDTGAVKEIQDNDDNSLMNDIICFATDPVIITNDMTDTFENVYIRSCSINLVSNFDIQPFVTANNEKDIPVVIRNNNQNGSIIFSGYVLPLSFNQGYSNKWNEFEVNSVDLLGTLENVKFCNLISSSDYMTPKFIIDTILTEAGFIDEENEISNVVYPQDDLLTTTKVNPSIFAGESQDDWMSCKEVLEELGKIYGWYFYQDGNTCHVENLLNYTLTSPVTMTGAMSKGNNVNLSISEAYNQINLTCDIQQYDDLFLDPFDDDYLQPLFRYSEPERYMTEYISPGEGSKAYNTFCDMLRGVQTTYDVKEIYDHYVLAKKNDLFTFTKSYDNISDNASVMQWLSNSTYPNNGCSAAFVSLGKTENMANPKDSKTVTLQSMTDYLVIQINGRDNAISASQMPTQIENSIPLCSVTLNNNNIAPPDSYTTNYLVFSGKIQLNPLQEKTGKNWNSHINKVDNTIGDCVDALDYISNHPTDIYSIIWNFWHRTVKHPSNGDGAYYQQYFFPSSGRSNLAFGPLGNDKNNDCQYQYNHEFKQVDDIDKLSIIACRLTVGEVGPDVDGEPTTGKYLVERTDLGTPNVFQWLTYNQLPTQGGSKLDYFTLGINPAIDDYLINKDYDISNNIGVGLQFRIDAKGTAIPITYEDHLSGVMKFEILGPINIEYNQNEKITKRKWIFWHKTTTSTTDIALLEKLENILISNFKMNLYSDNGGFTGDRNNDLVYYSRTQSRYHEIKEYETKFCTGLTTEEAAELEVDFSNNNSVILINDPEDETVDGTPYFGEYDSTSQQYIKLETKRVNEQYNVWNKPRKVVEATIQLENPEKCKFDTNYVFNYSQGNLSGTYKVFARDIDLKYDNMKVTLKDMTNL